MTVFIDNYYLTHKPYSITPSLIYTFREIERLQYYKTANKVVQIAISLIFIVITLAYELIITYPIELTINNTNRLMHNTRATIINNVVQIIGDLTFLPRVKIAAIATICFVAYTLRRHIY
jgi:hypothetical protein